MQKYQFEKVYKTMKKEFGNIRKGEEDPYYALMYAMEGNALKVQRKNPKSNSYRMKEAITLVLWDIWNQLSDEITEVDEFRNEDNSKLEYALLMAFDPYTNQDIQDYIDQEIKDFDLRKHYTCPVRALLRIRESIDIWEKRMGSDGYFKMYERDFGKLFSKDDEEMKFAIIYAGGFAFSSD